MDNQKTEAVHCVTVWSPILSLSYRQTVVMTLHHLLISVDFVYTFSYINGPYIEKINKLSIE